MYVENFQTNSYILDPSCIKIATPDTHSANEKERCGIRIQALRASKHLLQEK